MFDVRAEVVIILVQHRTAQMKLVQSHSKHTAMKLDKMIAIMFRLEKCMKAFKATFVLKPPSKRK